MEPEESKPMIETTDPTLPEGWEVAVSPVDGRTYYFNKESGATSWTHPSEAGATTEPAPAPTTPIETIPSLGDESGIMANRSGADDEVKATSTITTQEDDKDIEAGIYTKMSDYDPTKPINSFRCYSFMALILFFPLGAIALCKSFVCVSRWKQARYEQSHDAGQQALLFSRISFIIGVPLWAYGLYCYFAGPGAPYVIDVPAEWWPDFHEKYMNW
jgi:hypothetical protein